MSVTSLSSRPMRGARKRISSDTSSLVSFRPLFEAGFPLLCTPTVPGVDRR